MVVKGLVRRCEHLLKNQKVWLWKNWESLIQMFNTRAFSFDLMPPSFSGKFSMGWIICFKMYKLLLLNLVLDVIKVDQVRGWIAGIKWYLFVLIPWKWAFGSLLNRSCTSITFLLVILLGYRVLRGCRSSCAMFCTTNKILNFFFSYAGLPALDTFVSGSCVKDELCEAMEFSTETCTLAYVRFVFDIISRNFLRRLELCPCLLL